MPAVQLEIKKSTSPGCIEIHGLLFKIIVPIYGDGIPAEQRDERMQQAKSLVHVWNLTHSKLTKTEEVAG